MGYSPRGRKESDTTKQLSTHNILSGDHHFSDVLSCIHSINLYFYSSYKIYISSPHQNKQTQVHIRACPVKSLSEQEGRGSRKISLEESRTLVVR